MVFKDGDEILLASRSTKRLTRYLPELVAALASQLPDRCVFDGEIFTALDGRLEFERLSERIHPAASRIKVLSEQTPSSFVAFDVLALGDESLMEEPFSVRCARLELALASVTEARRAELVTELDELRVDLTDHPCGNWQDADAQEADRLPGATSRWSSGKDLSFVPIAPTRVAEVGYEHMEGTRFRHTAQFKRWHLDREPESCGYGQLQEVAKYDLANVLSWAS